MWRIYLGYPGFAAFYIFTVWATSISTFSHALRCGHRSQSGQDVLLCIIENLGSCVLVWSQICLFCPANSYDHCHAKLSHRSWHKQISNQAKLCHSVVTVCVSVVSINVHLHCSHLAGCSGTPLYGNLPGFYSSHM